MDKRLLIDTNIPLESLLDQKLAPIAEKIIELDTPKFITNFSVNSIALISLKNRVENKIFEQYLKFLLEKCELINLNIEDTLESYKLVESKKLDFDDSHIYFMAKKYNLKIITFDKHLLRYRSLAINGKHLI